MFPYTSGDLHIGHWYAMAPADVHAALFRAVEQDPGVVVKIDLARQTLTTPDGRAVEFPIDGFAKHCLLEGIDELGYILQQSAAIADYEASHASPISVT